MTKSFEDIMKEKEDSLSKGGNRNFSYVNESELERMGIPKYKIKERDNYIRVLPKKAVDGFYAMEIYKHNYLGPDKEVFLCLRTIGEDCPVCNLQNNLYQKDKNDLRAKALYREQRYLLFVVDTTNESSSDEGPKWMDCPKTVMKGLIEVSKDKRKAKWRDASDPKTGGDFEFVRGKSTKNTTEYSGFKIGESCEIPDEWYNDLPDYIDILKIPTPEELEENLACFDVSSNKEDKATNPRFRRERNNTPPDQKEEVVVEDENEEEKKEVKEEKETVKEKEEDDGKLSNLDRIKKRLREKQQSKE